MNDKGQVSSIDLVFAIIVFLTILGFSVSLWSGNVFELKANQDRNDLQRLSSQISDLLIKGGGVPDGWEKDTGSLITLGLANESHVLDVNKVNNFTNIPYSTIIDTLGAEGHYFHFQLKSQDGTVLKSMGAVIGSNSTNVASVSRNVLYNNSIVKMVITLWLD